MAENHVEGRLFCSYCGRTIGRMASCPHCSQSNEFLDVTPPKAFWDSQLNLTPWRKKTAVLPQKAESPPAPVAPKSEPTEPDLDDRTIRLPVDEDDRTIPLAPKEENPVVAVLICQEGSEDLRFELRQGASVVGRKGAPILLKNVHVSKKHALFNVEKAGSRLYNVSLTDQGAENGTFVNEERLEPQEPRLLKDQDIIKFAEVQFLYVAGGMFE